MKLIYLRFIDHCTKDTGWAKIVEIEDNIYATIDVVGFLVKEDENAYYLAQGVGIDEGNEDECRNIFIVIKSTVAKKKIIQRFK